MFYKKNVVKNFVKFTGKHLYRSLFFNKVVGLGFNKPLSGDSLFFTTQSPGWRRMKGCGLPWSQPVVLNPGLLDWESSALTTTMTGKRYVKCKCLVLINFKQTLHYKIAIE